MKAIEQWLAQSDPATLRKLTVFAEYSADGKPETYRACGMAGSTNGLAVYAKGSTLPEALDALDVELASQAMAIIDALDDSEGSEGES